MVKSTLLPDPLATSVQYVKGVGPYLGKLLNKKGIRTVQDLFYYFPYRYLDRRTVDTVKTLTPGKERCLVGEVVGSGGRRLQRSGRQMFEMVVKDDTGVALIVWFHFNLKYLKKRYPPGKKILIAGECQYYGNHKQFVHPEIEDWDEEAADSGNPIVPVYPLTDGLYQKTIRKIMRNAIDKFLGSLDECPVSVRSEGAKVSLGESLRSVHLPPAEADINELNESKSLWHQRIIYDEFFYLELGLCLKKIGFKRNRGYICLEGSGLSRRARGLLPFELTGAQERVLVEIESDLGQPAPMNRLLQGDVGCGKTLVAFLSALRVCDSNYQTAIMAPTEILARQHYKNLYSLAADLGVRIALLTGSTPPKERKEVLRDLENAKIQIIFGTHALIQEKVAFGRLGMIVIDEQHRFGVAQRAALKQKSETLPDARTPHILVMTATPIPRTLAMSLYGDLEVSIIDELPKGRQPTVTYVYHEGMRARAYDLIRRELRGGHQAYFVYPLIDESEKVDLKNAIAMAKDLSGVFKEYSVGLLHGRMDSGEKDSVMEEFKAGGINILVSTTVIEVGVDVPNATVMVVEHAERFGLSQLHQLRGRIGRGGERSYCLLMAGYARSEETRYRLSVMEQTTDGFKIAEEDLNMRGPGDFLGTRQSGLPEFRLGNLVSDQRLLTLAKRRAEEIVEADPLLEKEEYQVLRRILKNRWEGKLELGSVS